MRDLQRTHRSFAVDEAEERRKTAERLGADLPLFTGVLSLLVRVVCSVLAPRRPSLF